MGCLFKQITNLEVNKLLKPLDMHIGAWCEIKDTHNGKNVIYHVPRDADKMYIFAQHAANWIPKGKWKIFQIDNSTSLSKDAEIFLSAFLGKLDSNIDFSKEKSFLLKFDNDLSDPKKQFILGDIIFTCLLFECHAYIVSEGSRNGEIISIQDGAIFFLFRDYDTYFSTKKLISEYEKNPYSYPV